MTTNNYFHPPLGIYVHFPFCLKKCPYCDFTSYDDSPVDRRSYIDTVVKELNRFGNVSDSDFKARTLYFGGGTPSLMEPWMVEQVIGAVDHNCKLSPDIEITLEVNPATASAEDMRAWRKAGVNRVVIGVQSTDRKNLQILGRLHSPEETLAAVEAARGARFDAVGIDLIFGMPGQTFDNWEKDLERAVEMRPDHVSAYMLKPPRRWSVPPDEEIGKMYLNGVERLEAAGLSQYEVSNFAREGRQCRHNLNYWKSGDYLGLGVAAHSRMNVSLLKKTPETASGESFESSGLSKIPYLRWWNLLSPESYIDAIETTGSAIMETDAVDEKIAMDERLMLSLRLTEGMSFAGVDDNTASLIKKMGKELAEVGLAEITSEAIKLTPAGMLVADEIAARLAAML